jgi:hypothetical protein
LLYSLKGFIIFKNFFIEIKKFLNIYMKQDDFFKIIGIIIVSFFIIYMVVKMFQLQSNVIEGLTNSDTYGETGTAANYSANIKSKVIKLQDELLITKYRKDYESAIINLDDYIGYLMIQQVLNMKLDDDIKSNIASINALNILKNSKESLNATMTFLDKQ